MSQVICDNTLKNWIKMGKPSRREWNVMGNAILIMIITLTIHSFILYFVIKNSINNSELNNRITNLEATLNTLMEEVKKKERDQ
ncbi:hypothetical protein PZE06_25610 [Robertmurraya sp. DFI.2.37]|uniref:hypothetical protein n=1 Tax=Robertmurraya sp. DFI.2.37 TaxID=3031819 RepID=UPI0012443C2A|nr:hypothetical protein [Robertmurraya sp. DFI.2.37]MDF1511477.1 hypothetical protein [Robertmurraya sp. DFI.2.37]